VQHRRSKYKSATEHGRSGRAGGVQDAASYSFTVVHKKRQH